MSGKDKRKQSLGVQKSGPFPISVDDLLQLVPFDKRDDPASVDKLDQFGGVEAVAGKLKTDNKMGLSANISKPEIEDRTSWFGANIIPTPPPVPLYMMVWDNLGDPILRILIVGATVLFGLGMAFEGVKKGWIDAVAIFIAVIIVAAITSGNNYIKERQFQAILASQSQSLVTVIRSGERRQIPSTQVLVGDVVFIDKDNPIPADGIFIEGSKLAIDESPLTGETIDCKKSVHEPFIFAGTLVREGEGTMLITTVGAHSTGGRIQVLLNEQAKKATPLQEKLEDLADQIGYVAILAGVVSFVGLAVRFIFDTAFSDEFWQNSNYEQLVEAFVLGVTMVVVAVPEGLPLAVTISLAYSMRKMIKDQNFVRHLSASETMGEATCICSDKTGTLTENRMAVTKSLVGGIQDPASAASINQAAMTALLENCCINSKGYVEDIDGVPNYVGNKTDGAILFWVYKTFGIHYDELRKGAHVVDQLTLAFSSDRKRQSTGLQVGNGYRLHTKGAAEIVVGLCTKRLAADGTVSPLGKAAKAQLMEVIQSFTATGLRCISMGYKDMTEIPPEGTDFENNLTFVGIVGIKDPVRPEVPRAVQQCQVAGLVVRMVTGDNIDTAKHIAKECGILTDGGLALEGPVFRKLSDKKMTQIIPRLQVLARSSPQDKYILVSKLRKMGEVVAVTGDGTNDAPALKEADVGFAMGSGTAYARNASDIVLLDDNFSSIVKAIKWGRNVFDCIRKFLQFQLAVNLTAIVITVVGALVTGHSPLSAVQLLWVNLVMDTLGALALATDDPAEDILNRQPHKKTERIITLDMLIYIVIQTIFQSTVLLIILFYGYHLWNIDSDDPERVRTLVFSVFIFLQISNETNARVLDGSLNPFYGIHKNPFFPAIMLIIAVVQVLMVQFAGPFAQTEPLNIFQWLGVFAVALLNFPIGMLARLVIRQKNFIYKKKPQDKAFVADLAAATPVEQILALNEDDDDDETSLKVKAREDADEKLLPDDEQRKSARHGWTKVRTAMYFLSMAAKAKQAQEESQANLIDNQSPAPQQAGPVHLREADSDDSSFSSESSNLSGVHRTALSRGSTPFQSAGSAQMQPPNFNQVQHQQGSPFGSGGSASLQPQQQQGQQGYNDLI